MENLLTDKAKEDCKAIDKLMGKFHFRDAIFTRFYEPLSKFKCKSIEFYEGRHSFLFDVEYNLERDGELNYSSPTNPK